MRWLALVATAVALAPSGVRAHGVVPAVGQVAFDPADPNHIVARATWGYLTTRDGGRSWSWQCAAAVPFDRTRDAPPTVVLGSGAAVSATMTGIAVSDPAGCSWSAPATAPRGYTTDVLRDPSSPDVAWTIRSPGGGTPDTVERSDDDGLTWTVVGAPHPTALTDRILVAASDPSRIYTSGVVPAAGTVERQGMVLRSSDRGATWQALPVPLLVDERTVHVLAVDPTQADRLWARAVRSPADVVPERLLLSEDGGATWTAVLEAFALVEPVAVAEDGATVWAGSGTGGLYRSRDAGRTFVAIDPALRVRCLGHRPSELWVCSDGFATSWVLGRSADDGDTIQPVWSFSDLVNETGCGCGTPVHALCGPHWPDLLYDLMRLDGSLPDAGTRTPEELIASDCLDGGSGPPRPAASCGCSAGGAWREPGGFPGLELLLVLLVSNVRGRARTRG